MTVFDTDTDKGVLFAGRLWGLTRDRRSIKIVGNIGPISDQAFENLRNQDVVVLASSTPVVPFIVRPAHDRSVDGYEGQWEVVETSCHNVVATAPDQGQAQRVADALIAADEADEDEDVSFVR
jgi:hypothetical protein